ncbi:MAG: alpha/beta hydrolase [Aeromicrobium sp.]
MQLTTSDGAILDYRDTGSGSTGRTLVMLHGWSQSRAMYDRVIPLLSEKYRVVTYDQRGHGESPTPVGGGRIARLAQDLAELLDHLAIASADLVGHSMGSSVLWSFVDQHGTARVDSLVLVDQPSACVALPWMSPADALDAGAILDFPGAQGFVEGVLGPDSLEVRSAFLTSMLTADIPVDDYELLLAENLKLDAGFGARILLDHVMQDWRDVLGSIDVPTLVTAGEVSHVAPASQEWTAAHIPGARLRVFTAAEGGAHFPFFEAPEPFAEVLDDFLDSLPAPVRLATTAS